MDTKNNEPDLELQITHSDQDRLEADVLNGSWYLTLMKSPIFGDTILCYYDRARTQLNGQFPVNIYKLRITGDYGELFFKR